MTDNEVIVTRKEMLLCSRCGEDLTAIEPTAKRIPNPYMPEEMRIFNEKKLGAEGAKAINECNEQVYIFCPRCGAKNVIYDISWPCCM
jgi:ribosomal protein S27AE